MPSRRAVRITRQAISPRLAMRIFSNMRVSALKPSPSRGGLGGDGSRPVSQRSQDHFQHSFPVLENLVVPEPQHGEARLFQLSRPPVIVLRRLGMLSSVQFDYELSFDAGEIEDVVEIGRAHVELQSLMRISYAVFCLKKKHTNTYR